MPKFYVSVCHVVSKTITVEAASRDEAELLALNEAGYICHQCARQLGDLSDAYVPDDGIEEQE